MDLRDYAARDAVGLATLVRDGEVSAAEVEDAARRAVAVVDPALAATVGQLLEPALDAGDEGPLAGVPFAMKEVAPHLRGQVSQLGSRWAVDGLTGAADTHLGQRIRAAGSAGRRPYAGARVRVQCHDGARRTRAHAQPVESRAKRRRLERRGSSARRGARAAARPRDRRRRLDPHPGLALRDRRPEADACADSSRTRDVGGPARNGSRFRPLPHSPRRRGRAGCPARAGRGRQVRHPCARTSLRRGRGRRSRPSACAMDCRCLVGSACGACVPRSGGNDRRGAGRARPRGRGRHTGNRSRRAAPCARRDVGGGPGPAGGRARAHSRHTSLRRNGRGLQPRHAPPRGIALRRRAA